MSNKDNQRLKYKFFLIIICLCAALLAGICFAVLGYNGSIETEFSPGEVAWKLNWWDSVSSSTHAPSSTPTFSSTPDSVLEPTSYTLVTGIISPFPSSTPITTITFSLSVLLKGFDPATNTYDYLYLGRYPQIGDDDPILWRVLTVQDGQALLLSEKILDAHRYDTSSKTWEGSELKTWLNNDFISTAFNLQERAAIVNSTERGKVFPLLEDDLKKPEYGFTSNETDPKRSAIPTEHALGRAVDSRNGKSIYYTRTPGDGDNMVAVTSKGMLSLAGIERDDLGIRPAIWIRTSEFSISKGDGSLQQPYILL